MTGMIPAVLSVRQQAEDPGKRQMIRKRTQIRFFCIKKSIRLIRMP